MVQANQELKDKRTSIKRYSYTYGQSPIELSSPILHPSSCDFNYRCRQIYAENEEDKSEIKMADLCENVAESDDALSKSKVTFDASSGSYAFETSDAMRYPPGSYLLEISGSDADRFLTMSTLILIQISQDGRREKEDEYYIARRKLQDCSVIQDFDMHEYTLNDNPASFTIPPFSSDPACQD